MELALSKAVNYINDQLCAHQSPCDGKTLFQWCLNFSYLNYFTRKKYGRKIYRWCQKVNSKTCISLPFLILGPPEATSVMGFLQLTIFVNQKVNVFFAGTVLFNPNESALKEFKNFFPPQNKTCFSRDQLLFSSTQSYHLKANQEG